MRFNLRAYNKPSHNMITRCLTSLLLLLYAVLLVKGCDHCECDQRGALSSCQLTEPHCKPHHDLVTEETNCDVRGMKCCRMTCDGPGTMCLPRRGPFDLDSAYADLGPKTCKEGFECVKAPSRLKEKLRVH